MTAEVKYRIKHLRGYLGLADALRYAATLQRGASASKLGNNKI